MTLSEDDLVVLRGCMDRIVQNSALASEYFHQELFALAPKTRALYKMDLKRQGPLLMSRLGVIMARMHESESLRPFVEDMAKRHVAYGVQIEHYPAVRQALITAFRRIMGADFNTEVEGLLGEAYDHIARAMIEHSYPQLETKR